MLNFDMPEDVRIYVLKIQGEIKSKKGLGKYSQQQTIVHIIRDYISIKEKQKK